MSQLNAQRIAISSQMQVQQGSAKRMAPGKVNPRLAACQAAKQVARHIGSLIRTLPSQRKSTFSPKKLSERSCESESEEGADESGSVLKIQKKSQGGGEGGFSEGGGFQEQLEQGHAELIEALNQKGGLKRGFQKVWIILLEQSLSDTVSSHSLTEKIGKLFTTTDEYGLRVVCEHLEEQLERLQRKERLDPVEKKLLLKFGQEQWNKGIDRAIESVGKIYRTLLPQEAQRKKASFGAILDQNLQHTRELIDQLPEKEEWEIKSFRKALYELIESFAEKEMCQVIEDLEIPLSSDEGWDRFEDIVKLVNQMVSSAEEIKKGSFSTEKESFLLLHLLLNVQKRLRGIYDSQGHWEKAHKSLENNLRQEDIQLSPALKRENLREEQLSTEKKKRDSSLQRIFSI